MPYEEIDLTADMPNGVRLDDWLNRQGWQEFLRLGSDATPISVISYRRTVAGKDEYVAIVWDVNQGSSPFLKVPTFADLMDLLARWAPAIQAAVVAHVFDDINGYSLDDAGLVELVAAKAAWGASSGLDEIRRHEREAAEHRRRLRAARKATATDDRSANPHP